MRRLALLVGAIVLVDTMFYAAITPLLPRLADELDLGKNGAGMLAGAYAAGTLVGSLPGGWLAARVGVKATILVGIALMAGSGLAFAFGSSIALLDGARFLQGENVFDGRRRHERLHEGQLGRPGIAEDISDALAFEDFEQHIGAASRRDPG